MTKNEMELFVKHGNPDHPGYNEHNPYVLAFLNSENTNNLDIIRKLDERVAIVKIRSKTDFENLKQKIKIETANYDWKLAPGINIFNDRRGIFSYIIAGNNLDSLLASINGTADKVEVLQIIIPTKSVIIKTSQEHLKDKLLPLPEIIFIDKVIPAKTEIGIIGYNNSFHNLNLLQYEIPGATGENITVGIKEDNMDSSDLDLFKRVDPSSHSSNKVSNHATSIATLIGGAGNTFYDGRGVADGCRFYSSSFANLFADDAMDLVLHHVTVQNHSYGTLPQQYYGAEAMSYDLQTWQNKQLIHVFSAGNSGLTSSMEGKYANLSNYANITGNFKMAKNIISVAAVSANNEVAEASSAGPLYDGRLAPQITAYGPGGTSDAAALISGTIAVMQQVYRDSNQQQLPAASLIKAILFNTTDDIFRLGIDYKTGYGMLNSYEAIKTIQHKLYDTGQISPNQTWTTSILIPGNASEFKITLAWTDSPSSLNNNKALVNDLDLEIKDLDRDITYKPWVLNEHPSIGALSSLPSRKRDSLNTAEQISVALPAAGLYEISIHPTILLNTSIPFHLAYHVDTFNTFKFTNPLSSLDINREENEVLDIRWRCFVHDPDAPGDLFVSYDGNQWDLLKENVSLVSRSYLWNIKDTNSVATFKMITSFGTFFSNKIIISKVLQPRVEFNCTDSFKLSWNKHIYAQSYTVFSLGESPYLEPILMTKDTFKTFHRKDYTSNLFAIQPILSNNLSATRSRIVNVTTQGVQCFYKTFYYTLLDKNKLELFLELSTSQNIDSLFFEQLTPGGQLLKVTGALKTSNQLTYRIGVNELNQGTSYFRVKIKFKNNDIIYTETISILTSGSKPIIFYPNPVNRGTPLNYVLIQGTSLNSKLQLFDLAGHLIRTLSAFNSQLDISQFSAGIVFYKLVSGDSKITIDSGKIIIL